VTVAVATAEWRNARDAAFPAKPGWAGLANEPFATTAGPLPVTASFGISPLDPALGLEATLKACDLALYKAKESGRNRIFSAQPADKDARHDPTAI